MECRITCVWMREKVLGSDMTGFSSNLEHSLSVCGARFPSACVMEYGSDYWEHPKPGAGYLPWIVLWCPPALTRPCFCWWKKKNWTSFSISLHVGFGTLVTAGYETWGEQRRWDRDKNLRVKKRGRERKRGREGIVARRGQDNKHSRVGESRPLL